MVIEKIDEKNSMFCFLRDLYNFMYLFQSGFEKFILAQCH